MLMSTIEHDDRDEKISDEEALKELNAATPIDHESVDRFFSFSDDTEDDEWISENDEIGVWNFLTNEKLGELYERADKPTYPSDPVRYDPTWGVYIIPGSYVDYSYGYSLPDIMDEYENMACFFYEYRFCGDAYHAHQHSFNGVVASMMKDPVNFYIPTRAVDQYSEQEILFLELLRERLCADNGEIPVCDIIDVLTQEDRESYKNDFASRVKQRIEDIRSEQTQR